MAPLQDGAKYMQENIGRGRVLKDLESKHKQPTFEATKTGSQ